MRKLVVALVVICIAVGASVGVVFGTGSSSSTALRTSAFNDASKAMHRVSAPSGGAGVVAAKRPHRAKLIYLETRVFTLRHGDTQGANGVCPRRSQAINGYFANDTPGVFPTFDSRGTSLRKWTIAVDNTTTDTNARVLLGTVCLKP